MDLVKKTFIKTMAGLGKLEDYQLFFLVSLYEVYDESYTDKEPDWDVEILEEGSSSFQEIQDILRIYFEKSVPRDSCLTEMFKLERYRAICLYLTALEKRKQHLTSKEQDKIVQLPYEYFILLKCKLDDKYVEKLLEEGNFAKLSFYLSNFLISNRLEKRLVSLSQKVEYRNLLQEYIKVHLTKGHRVFGFGDALYELVNFADTETLLMYLDFCSVREWHLPSQSVLDLFERPNDGNQLLIKYLEKSFIKDNEIFEKIYNKAETQQLKDMLSISDLRLFLSNMEYFSSVDFKIERGMSTVEKRLIEKYYEDCKQQDVDKARKEIIKRLHSGHVSPDMAAWCAANIDGVSSLALSAMIKFAQLSHDRVWRVGLHIHM
jgi:hypothetical protein